MKRVGRYVGAYVVAYVVQVGKDWFVLWKYFVVCLKYFNDEPKFNNYWLLVVSFIRVSMIQYCTYHIL